MKITQIALISFVLFQFLISSLISPRFALAQTSTAKTINVSTTDTLLENPEATLAGEAAESTDSGKLSSPSAEVVEKLQQKTDQDITETSGQKKSVLAAYLDEHPVGKLSWNNLIQKAIRKAISSGMPANIIVILLIFPIIASLVAFSRHVIGLKGFGIYIPAVLSVAFVSTGILTGVTVFVAVLLAALFTRPILKKLKLPMLPRTAMLLMSVSITVLALMLVGSIYNIDLVIDISIFPLLIIILLTENFMETQLFNSQKEALQITFETLLIAVLCSLILGSETIQKFVILRPELTLIGVALINFAIGKYTGLRFLEYLRFRDLLNQNNKFKDTSSDNNSQEEE
ncbi:MAG: hypothetical protein UT13_C0001G0672 [Candidatus Pacebacteria bacterium GW2011_GWF2_38_9]|nr:MAG: hypothetical protein US01_C0001G0703 [candidate division TM6 bacterium GW2011_GWF2_28_16]KKQ10068.1 MAG: hypothetical protein US20_C0003G0007 [Candidatus Pacebacteria bacterium GW2011_GWF1_36_5]KKQ89025.1 MAG: hypothetical protein UT13_C0001G0672 [Candidatus Pacebacteria bacterium GW2011_GWF2_38_9]HAZ73200.1 hypothetical protein [Candidatus Paceibacterota bacterium]